MRLITARTIDLFAREHADAAQALADWCAIVEAARWTCPDDVRRTLGNAARPIGSRRVIFNIKGNAYRIVVEVRYASPEHNLNGIVRVHFVGTHAQYDAIDASTVTFHTSAP